MFYVKYELYGQQNYELLDNFEMYKHIERTFNPDTQIVDYLNFYTGLGDYYSRKQAVRYTAIEWSIRDTSDICISDLIRLQDWFTKYGKRYGLLQEFRENGII